MLECDVLIIGAGPAGITVAKTISEKDIYKKKIIILEKSKLPRDKPCGGLLTDESKILLKKFYQNLLNNENLYERPKILDLRYVDLDNNFISKKITRNYLNVNRKEFDMLLLNEIQSYYNISIVDQAKAIELEKVKVSNHNSKEKGYIVKFYDKKTKKINYIKTKYIIGADGPISTVRTKFLKKEPPNYYLAYQKWFYGKLDDDSFTYVLCDKVTDFYSWIIPKGDKIILGLAVKVNSREELDKKFTKIQNALVQKNILEINSTLKIESGIISRPRQREDIFLGMDNILLVGEAAGLISPTTGEGISYALRSGMACAETILNKSGLNKYEELVDKLIKEIEIKFKKAENIRNEIKLI